MTSSREAFIREFNENNGGYLQREAARESYEDASSAFALELETLWTWGWVSPPAVGRLAAAVVHDDNKRGIEAHPTVLRLAKLAEETSHTRRSILTAFPIPKHCPKPFDLRVPCAPFKRGGALKFVSCSIMLINVVIECMYRHYPAKFGELLRFGVEAFWRQVKPDDPKLINHPMRVEKHSWWTRAVPLLMHGDAAKFTSNGNSLLSVQMSSLLTVTWSMATMFLCMCFPKACRSYGSVHGPDGDTWKTLWKYVAHAIKSLYLGVHPQLDPDGQPWEDPMCIFLAGKPVCGGNYFFVMWGYPMDHEYACNEMHCNHWTRPKPCTWCPVDTMNGDVLDHRICAPWKAQTYLITGDPGPVSAHAGWGMPGVTRYHYMGDYMHTGHGGTVAHMHLGCLQDFIDDRGPLPGGTKDHRTNRLWRRLQQAYDDCGIAEERLQCLTPSMVSTDEKFLTCKMAISKVLIEPMLHLCRLYDDGSLKSGHRIVCYESLLTMQEMMDRGELFLLDDDVEPFLKKAEAFLVNYAALCNMHILSGVPRYYMDGYKFHGFWHIAYFARWLSPKAVHCYKWENFIAKVQRMAKTCVIGTPMHKVPKKVFENYARAFGVELRK